MSGIDKSYPVRSTFVSSLEFGGQAHAQSSALEFLVIQRSIHFADSLETTGDVPLFYVDLAFDCEYRSENLNLNWNWNSNHRPAQLHCCSC